MCPDLRAASVSDRSSSAGIGRSAAEIGSLTLAARYMRLPWSPDNPRKPAVSLHGMHSDGPASAFRVALARALDRRRALIDSRTTQAFRVFSGAGDGIDGVFIDVYADGAVLIEYEGRPPGDFDAHAAAGIAQDVLRPLGVRAVYHKPFAKDRSRLGGALPDCVTNPIPAAGERVSESTLIREHDWNLEVRLYDGLSTGLFLDQRENRRWIAEWTLARSQQTGTKPTVLNTFAYTCAFSVAAAMHAVTTSVDVSPRYLEWGKRNFTHNQIDVRQHFFTRMDTFEFFGFARKKSWRYDLMILDPPSFASGSKKKGIKPWSALEHYSRLVNEAAGLLAPGGVIFASTNTQELCRTGRLEREIAKAVGRPKWVDLPEIGIDFAEEHERFSARAFAI